MANPASTTELLDLLRKSGIYTADGLDRALVSIELPEDPVKSAAVMVRKGLLSAFQAKLLLNGRYRGFKLGPYVVKDQIGQGGMGTVYLAEHGQLRRKVAVKVLKPQDKAHQVAVERFLREARAAAALDHPNIVRIHDVGQHGEVHYLVMEYVEGQTLDQLVEKAGPIACGRAVEYMTQAAAGLQHAYEKGFVHRDIKPGNLMLAKDGTVKILDMGLARSLAGNDKLTEVLDAGAVVGTADYISPEQAMNAPDLDIRADIYSLGASFFTLVTGRPPFEGTTTQKLLHHQMKSPPSLAAIDRTFPAGLAEVVAKMLAKKPEDRYATPADVIAALTAWLPNSARLAESISRTNLKPSVRNTVNEMVSGNTRDLTKKVEEALTPPAAKKKLSPLLLAGGSGVALALLAVGGLALSGVFSGGKPDPVVKGGPVVPPPAVKGTPPVVPPVQPPAAGKSLFRLDLAGLPTFRHRFKAQQVVSGTSGNLPAGTGFQTWKEDTEAEFAVEPVDGRPALSLTNVTGSSSAQLMLNLESPSNGIGLTLTPDRRYEVRFEYKTVGGATSKVYTQSTDYKTMGDQTMLAGTDGQWRAAVFSFVRGKFPLRLLIDVEGIGPGKTLYLRAVDVLEVAGQTGAAAPAPPAAKPPAPAVAAAPGRKVFALDLAGLPTFRGRFADGKPDGDYPVHRPGLSWYCWKKESSAEFRGEPTDRGPALGVTNLNDEPSSQFNLVLEDGAGLTAGRRYALRVEYKTVNDAAGTLQVRDAEYKSTAQTALPGTDGGWQWAEVAFDRAEGQKLHAVVENTSVGEGNSLWLRAATLHEAK